MNKLSENSLKELMLVVGKEEFSTYAAAPDMLAALKLVSDAFWAPMTADRITIATEVDAAIAKAEGRQ